MLLSLLVGTGCSGTDSGGGTTETGGTPASGGAGSLGGNATTGGASLTSNSQPGSGGSSIGVTGGSASTGGQSTAAGGSVNAGGSVSTSTGGATSSGGSTAASGGATTKGGASSVGGTTAKGGSTSAGGSTAKGGATSAGGSSAKGGSTSAGGAVTQGGSTSAGGATAKGGSTSAGGTSVVMTPNITIDTATQYQTIDGFGAALPMWGSSNNMWTTDEVHKFVGMSDTELGFTILRTIIDPDTNRWSYAVANLKEGKAYGSGVKILATPWSPPASMKTNGSTNCAGLTGATANCRLNTSSYAAYATHLNNYVTYMTGQGVAVDVVSIQNEPDWPTDYDSCLWNGTEFLNFVKNNASAIKNTKLMIPESLQFTRSYSDPTLNDATAAGLISYIGGHLYGAEASGKLSEYALANTKGKPQWMTEYNFHEADGSGAAIWGADNQAVWNESLDEVLKTVHLSMAAKWSAYVWWWGRRYYSFIGDGEAAFGTTKSAVLKRGWAFSHYSKFVRPGYVRVGLTLNTSYSNLQATAYQGTGKIVAVLLNRSTSDYNNVVFKIPSTVTAAQAYVTSQTTNRTALTITPAGQYATVNLPKRSIVTVVLSN